MSDLADYFAKGFNTALGPEMEDSFAKWLASESTRQKRDVSKDLADYDLRGAFAEGAGRDPNGHMTDKWKKPNHPTFSEESVYHGTMSPMGVPYQGGRWSDDGSTYQPSTMMLGTTHREDDLRRYMREVEPNVILQILKGAR